MTAAEDLKYTFVSDKKEQFTLSVYIIGMIVVYPDS